jgi:hypothetical protein
VKHAVVYVPGGSQQWLDQSAGVVAERLAVALCEQRRDLKDIRITLTKGALRLGEHGVDRARLEGLSADGRWSELVDIYEVDYVPAFVAPFVHCNSFERALSAAGVFGGSFARLRQVSRARSKGFLDKVQGASLNLLMVFLAAYLLYWCALAIAGVLAAFGITGTAVLQFGGWKLSTEETALAFALVAGTAALTRLATHSWFAKIERSAIEYFALCRYLRNDGPFGACHAIIRDTVVELRRGGYERVDLMAFSLGCLIAGDAIWPRRAGLRATPDKVDGFATIGYPYDLVRAAYGNYFTGRKAPALTIAGRWWNVTEPEDFLGSNFRDDHLNLDPDPASGILHEGGTARPTHNIFFDASARIGKKAASWLDAVWPMRRVVNHRIYWDPADPRGESCFRQLVAAGFCNLRRPIARPARAPQPRSSAPRAAPAKANVLQASP